MSISAERPDADEAAVVAADPERIAAITGFYEAWRAAVKIGVAGLDAAVCHWEDQRRAGWGAGATGSSREPGVRLYTASFQTFRGAMGQPVVISLTTPSWMDVAKEWPKCWYLMPRWAYFRTRGEEFADHYMAQLERFGHVKIVTKLQEMAAECGDDRLVLLCHETDRRTCHRRLAGEWLTAHGWEVAEATMGPAPKGPFRVADEQGRQIVMVGRYSYAWPGDKPLAAGDPVWLPPNRWRTEPKLGKVKSIGSDYAGPLVELLEAVTV